MQIPASWCKFLQPDANMVSCTIWYHIIQYGIILYNMVSYCTIWYHIVQYDIILYNMVSYCTIWYHILPYFIIFYSMFHHFTEKSIKSTFWPGFLPLQGTPTGENNWFLSYFIIFYHILQYVSSFYRKIDKMHILARIFAPARHTHRRGPMGPWAHGPMGPMGPLAIWYNIIKIIGSLKGTTGPWAHFIIFLHHCSLFYRKIDKMHIWARIFAPARHTHWRK